MWIDFEADLAKLKDKMQDDVYAQHAYHSLCNVEWLHDSAPKNWREIVKKDNDDFIRRRDIFWRSWPREVLRLLRRYVTIPISHKEVKSEYEIDGEKHQGISIRSRKFLWRIDLFLLDLEMKLFPKWPDPHQWLYGCSWRYAGGMVAEIRGQNGDYMDYYCSGREGRVSQEFADDMAGLGWIPVWEENEKEEWD